MIKRFKRPLSIALGALATTTLGGCYAGDVYGSSYASGGDCSARYGDAYYDSDGYAYDDGYGYDCYDGADYGSGFAQIGFGGGWYDDYYYPGYGMWMFDNYRNRYPLRGNYLNYWGGRRAWWKHHGGRGDVQPRRPGGWNRGDRDNDGPRGTRPPRPGNSAGAPPATTRPANPGRPGRGDATRPNRPGRGNGDGIGAGRPGGGRPDGARPSRPAPSTATPSPHPAPAARPAQPPRPVPSAPRGRGHRASIPQ